LILVAHEISDFILNLKHTAKILMMKLNQIQIWGPLIWFREKVAMNAYPSKKTNTKSAGFGCTQKFRFYSKFKTHHQHFDDVVRDGTGDGMRHRGWGEWDTRSGRTRL
jgi:hypothetical protein